jgi:hypothetical protein
MTWGAIYNRYVKRGHDHADAAFRADQWEKRQQPDRWRRCPSTHCERRQECASPHECCAKRRLPTARTA